MKKSIRDINVAGSRVLVRLDLNVPLRADGQIADDRRIRAALPTVKHIIEGGGRAILISHLGRPSRESTSGPEDHTRLTLEPIAKRLGELISRPVRFVSDCMGQEAASAVDTLGDGELCMLENLRFHEAETIKDKDAAKDASRRSAKDAFAKSLACLADVYVNDAFGTCHRDNASMLTVPQLMNGKPRVVGFLVQRELDFLGKAIVEPKRPFVCILGGAKVSDKLGVIHALLGKCDTILIGGAMAYTFLAADGACVGNSLVEPDLYETARALRIEAGDRLKLPVDSVAASSIGTDTETTLCDRDMPDDLMGLDIGPKTIEAYQSVIGAAGTIVWNGPMGVFETPPFDRGTLAIAQAVAAATDAGAISVIGGGDSAAAIDQAGLAERVSHVSTGGGASLEFLEGKRFAALDALDDA